MYNALQNNNKLINSLQILISKHVIDPISYNTLLSDRFYLFDQMHSVKQVTAHVFFFIFMEIT